MKKISSDKAKKNVLYPYEARESFKSRVTKMTSVSPYSKETKTNITGGKNKNEKNHNL